jgi:predicted metal-dependent phosphoesterase TrpH
VLIDLHTHSRASDGTQSPAEVMAAAARAGLDVVALTDHDTMQGWEEASAAATELGLDLVLGIEISTRFGSAGVHLLASLPDRDDPDLVATLERILEGRNDRVPAIVERLREVGVDLTEDDVRRESAGTPAPGRPHVADALVARGVVGSRVEAFERYLNPGRPGYARRFAADLEDVVPLVVAAGGVPVVALPWGRTARAELTVEAFGELRELGLAGIEVDHQDHSPAEREQLRAIARDLDLVVTGSSDYHGAGKVDHELGCHTTAPEELARIRELAERARATRAAGPSRFGLPAPW